MKSKDLENKSEKSIKTLLEASEEKFKQLLKNSFDMIVLLDSNGIQHYVSESCEKILGYKPHELINMQVIDEMIHPDDRKKTKQGFQNILTKSNHGGTQYRHKHKNGSWVYLEAYGTNQIDNSHIKSIVLNVRDITERKKAEEALMESEKRLSELNATKDRFFSIIAHDLMSPFGSILGFSDLLINEVKEKNYAHIDKYAKNIQKSAGKTKDLLNNLLVWAQSQTGKIEFKPEYIELKTVIETVLELLNHTSERKAITFSKNLPDNSFIFADEQMINAMLRNLISNAIKFSNFGKEIKINVKFENDKVTVSVIDNGTGIQQEDLTKLFSIEHNYSTPGTGNEIGTGLGLLLCKEFVEMHKGKIWVESKPGKGSAFHFTIPNSDL
mgnify:CR=1 FL=1